jgi:hypothetical protein
MAAAGMSYDSPGPAVLGLPARPAIEAVQAVTAPHRRLQDHQQQQQEEEEVEAAVSPLEVTATTTTTTSSSSSSRLSSSARTALSVLGGQVVAVPGHMALLLDLQRRWAGYQLARMGQAAQDSFSTASQAVSSFVPFGQQWYLTSSGAVPLVPLPPRAYEPTSPDAQDFLAKHPGMFSFHRWEGRGSRPVREGGRGSCHRCVGCAEGLGQHLGMFSVCPQVGGCGVRGLDWGVGAWVCVGCVGYDGMGRGVGGVMLHKWGRVWHGEYNGGSGEPHRQAGCSAKDQSATSMHHPTCTNKVKQRPSVWPQGDLVGTCCVVSVEAVRVPALQDTQGMAPIIIITTCITCVTVRCCDGRLHDMMCMLRLESWRRPSPCCVPPAGWWRTAPAAWRSSKWCAPCWRPRASRWPPPQPPGPPPARPCCWPLSSLAHRCWALQCGCRWEVPEEA